MILRETQMTHAITTNLFPSVAGTVLALWFVGAVPSPGFAQASAAPSGWKSAKAGKDVTLTPRDLPSGATFTVIVEPPFALRDDPSVWLQTRLGKEAEALGTATDSGQVKPFGAGTLDGFSLVRTVRLSSGEERLLSGFLARRPDGQMLFVRVISSPEEGVYKRYLPMAMRGFVTLARGGASKGGTGTGVRTVRTPKTKAPVRPKGSAAYTRAGAGPKTSEIVGIYTRIQSQMGYGGMMTLNNLPTVVFKDGTYYEDYDVPLPDFDVAAARRERPTAWGKWRRQGGVIQILSDKRGWEKAEWLGPFPGAKPGEKLSGRYFSVSGGGDTAFGGGTAYGAESDIRFSPDGRFTTDLSTSLSSEVSNVQATASGRKATSGTYTLNGYTLTMKYDDGQVIRRAFVFMDTNGKQEGMYLDGIPYPKGRIGRPRL